MEQRKGRRLVLFPLPLQGHINPMIQLANILYAEGFSITIIHTTFHSPDPSNYPQFTFHFILEELTETEASTTYVIALTSLLNIRCVAPFRDCLANLLSDVSEEPIACLISDAIFHFTAAVSYGLKLPRIVLRTGAASSFRVFAALPFLREKLVFPLQESRLEEPVAELPPLKVKDLPVVNSLDPESVYELLVSMVDATKVSSGIIWNSFEELEQSALAALGHEFHIPIFPVGPFHKRFPSSSSGLLKQDQSSISWLDKQAPKSVVYVSFGSVATINQTEFLEIALGLGSSKQPFLWVFRQGSVGGAEWLELLPKGLVEDLKERGHIVEWAPQSEVLAHPAVGAFWTHNGWNSTLESICEGVPMICMPRFTDQMSNARYVSDVWKVGLQLENGLKRDKIERTIKRLLIDRQGEDIRKRILCLKEKANLSVRRGGSSCRSLDNLVGHILSLQPITSQNDTTFKG